MQRLTGIAIERCIVVVGTVIVVVCCIEVVIGHIEIVVGCIVVVHGYIEIVVGCVVVCGYIAVVVG